MDSIEDDVHHHVLVDVELNVVVDVPCNVTRNVVVETEMILSSTPMVREECMVSKIATDVLEVKNAPQEDNVYTINWGVGEGSFHPKSYNAST